MATRVAGPLGEQGDPDRVLARALARRRAGPPSRTRRPRRRAGTASTASPTFAGSRPPASVIGTSRATAAARAASMRIPVPPGWGPPAASSRIPVAPAARNARAVLTTSSATAPGATRRALETGRPTAATADGGSSPLSWTSSGSTAAMTRASSAAGRLAVTTTIRGRGRSAGGRRAGQPGQLHALLDRERARRPGREVEPDGVRARPGRGQDPGRVGHAADLDPRRAGVARGIHGVPARRHEGAGGGGRVGGAHQRLAHERRVEPGGAPAGDGRGVADPGLGDGQAIAGDQRPAAGRPAPGPRRASAGPGC